MQNAETEGTDVSNRPIRGVVFDMDGVLFDSEPVHIRAWQQVLAEDGIAYPTGWFADWIGIPDRDLAAHLEGTHPVLAGGDRPALLMRKREAYRLAAEEMRAFEGLRERLDALAAQIPLAVATSSRRDDLEMLLPITGLAGRFPVRVGYEETDAHKPDPAPYRLAAARLGLDPSCCAAVEDSPQGIASARGAGMLTAAVTTSFAEAALHEADGVFASTAEACDWIAARIGPPAGG